MKQICSLLCLGILTAFIFCGCGNTAQSKEPLPIENTEDLEETDKGAIENPTINQEDNKDDLLGIQLSVFDVTPTGLKLVCNQSGGKPTGELTTGSKYWLDKEVNGIWEAIESIQGLAWTDEAWIINRDQNTEWTVDWEIIYGILPDGKYRIGKEVSDFRETGDYDTYIYYAEFEIKQ